MTIPKIGSNRTALVLLVLVISMTLTSVVSVLHDVREELNRPTDPWGAYTSTAIIGDRIEGSLAVRRYVGDDGIVVVDGGLMPMHAVRCGPEREHPAAAFQTWEILGTDGVIVSGYQGETQRFPLKPPPDNSDCFITDFKTVIPPEEVIKEANGQPFRVVVHVEIEGYLPVSLASEFMRVGKPGVLNSTEAMSIPRDSPIG